MANKVAELMLRLSVREGADYVVDEDLYENERFATSILKQETITVNAATFQQLTVPTGARLLVIELGTAEAITLKGVTGDTGVKLTPASDPLGLPAIIPLGDTPSVGILNGDASAVDLPLTWL